MMYFQNKNIAHAPTQGFTLVETLVAITILLLVILAPMTIASRGLKSAFYANDQTTAVFLVQEAIESLEKLRDNNALESLLGTGNSTWDWYADIDGFCKNAPGCDLEQNGSYHACTSDSDCTLQINPTPSSGEVTYGYGAGWPDSPYTRKIVLTPQGSGIISVTVTVSWRSNLFTDTTREVVLTTWLYDHYNRFEP